MVEIDSFVVAVTALAGSIGAYVKARYDTYKDRQAIAEIQNREKDCRRELNDLKDEALEALADNRNLQGDVAKLTGSLDVVMKLLDRRVRPKSR